jgi:hypothetical protein
MSSLRGYPQPPARVDVSTEWPKQQNAKQIVLCELWVHCINLRIARLLIYGKFQPETPCDPPVINRCGTHLQDLGIGDPPG